MGYPMTFRRVIDRNSLQDGDYDEPPSRHAIRVPTDAASATTLSIEETKIHRHDHLANRCEEYEAAFRMIAGDLRRLERDTLDERGCELIAARVGTDADTVAAVLREWIA